jgi:hypothetical protein
LFLAHRFLMALRNRLRRWSKWEGLAFSGPHLPGLFDDFGGDGGLGGGAGFRSKVGGQFFEARQADLSLGLKFLDSSTIRRFSLLIVFSRASEWVESVASVGEEGQAGGPGGCLEAAHSRLLAAVWYQSFFPC